MTLVLPYVKTAREKGVLRLRRRFLEEYGTYESTGFISGMCESVVGETIGGHHWMARPDDAYVSQPN